MGTADCCKVCNDWIFANGATLTYRSDIISACVYSLNRPALLSDLLAHVGSHYVDPLKLMKRIPAETEIPLLKQKLVRILSDCQLQVCGCL